MMLVRAFDKNFAWGNEKSSRHFAGKIFSI